MMKKINLQFIEQSRTKRNNFAFDTDRIIFMNISKKMYYHNLRLFRIIGTPLGPP